MTKFLIDIELDGYDDYEEMLNSIDEGEVSDALETHGYTVISVERFYGCED